jgi:predicted ester cyclase
MDIIDQILASNFVRHGDYIGGQGEIRGSAAYKDVVTTFRKLLPDLHSEIYDVIEQGERIAFRFRTSGKYGGRNIEFEGVNILRFESDKIAENWIYYDATGLAERLGQKKVAA